MKLCPSKSFEILLAYFPEPFGLQIAKLYEVDIQPLHWPKNRTQQII